MWGALRVRLFEIYFHHRDLVCKACVYNEAFSEPRLDSVRVRVVIVCACNYHLISDEKEWETEFDRSRLSPLIYRKDMLACIAQLAQKMLMEGNLALGYSDTGKFDEPFECEAYRRACELIQSDASQSRRRARVLMSLCACRVPGRERLQSVVR